MIIISPREILPLRYNIITTPRNLLSNTLPSGAHIMTLRSRVPTQLIRKMKNHHVHKQASQKLPGKMSAI
jgi:hypothetical protein